MLQGLMPAVPSRVGGGWGAIFNTIVRLQGKTQFATFLSQSIVNVYSQWQSRQRRIPTVDGRSRARHRRALIRDLLRTYIVSSLQWLRTGCSRPSEAPAGRRVRQLASRAALDACRTSPLAFAGDKRGRLREVLAGTIHRIPSPLETSTLEFSAGPAAWNYDGSTRPTGARKVTSARIALADPACVVKLSDWLAEETARIFVTTEATDDDVVRRYFNVSMSEWRMVVRRMARCGLATSLSADACPTVLSGRVFAVAKDSTRDRLNYDRRPQNSQKGSVGRVLPCSPRLRRLILHRSCALGVRIYFYEADPARWRKQVVGPRVPASWLHDVFDESLDSLPADSLDAWWESDLRNTRGRSVAPEDYRQLAITGIMMGDTNAIAVLELAHRRQLISAGVLSPEASLLPGRPLPDGPEFGDVYIDDLVLFLVLHMSQLHHLQDCPRAARAKRMPIRSDKSCSGFKTEFWGSALDGISGSLGFSMPRLTALMYVTLLGARLGITRGSLQQILGAWNLALSFRKEALCCLDDAFLCARKLPRRRHTPAHGALLDDLLLVAGIGPLLQADLHTQPRYDLFATDASPSGAGACIAKVTPGVWHSLYRIAKERGKQVQLDWGLAAPPPFFISSHSPATAPITPAAWTELFAYRFRVNDHINVLELGALVSLLRRLSNQGARRQRILCCVDSTAVLCAVSKGRSSSRKPNHVLRKLAYECLASSLTVDLLWVPSWANPADAPSRRVSLDRWRRDLPFWPMEHPSVVRESTAVIRELKPLQESLPARAIALIGPCLAPPPCRPHTIDAGYDSEVAATSSRHTNLCDWQGRGASCCARH